MRAKNKNTISEEAAIELLKRVFSMTPVGDTASLEEIYQATNRIEEKPETNRNWMNGTLSKLKQHNLVAPTYKFANKRNRLSGLQLTITGKTALGRLETTPITPARTTTVGTVRPGMLTMDELLHVIEDLRVKHPNWEIVFELKPKGGQME